MHAYHVTVLLPTGQRRVCAVLCAHPAAAFEAAQARHPGAQRYSVRRLSTVLAGTASQATQPPRSTAL